MASQRRDSYARGFSCGRMGLNPRPPGDAGERWEYWNGFLDATQDMGVGDYGVVDQERAEFARRQGAARRAARAQEEQAGTEHSGWPEEA